MALDVPSLEEVKDEIRDDVEYLKAGNGIICEIDTEEYTTARQKHKMFGEEGALKELAKAIRKRKRREAKRQRDEEFREEQRKVREELREEREERMQEQLEREKSYIEDIK